MALATEAPTLVTLSIEGPRPQRRLSVGFRFILAFPHFLYLAVLGFVGFFAVVAGWFAALVLGRLPVGIAEFTGRILQYIGRVTGYGTMLLTDRYPPFALDAEDYAISVVLQPPGRLNRAAVLFRFLLLVPAFIVVQVLSAGLTVVMFFFWLIVLVVGRLPTSLFEAQAAMLRYQMRAYAYAIMLTSDYPRRLFGDPGLPAEPDEADGATDSLPPPPQPPDDFLASTSVTPSPASAPSAQPRITRLVLSKPGKRLLVVIIVIGIIFSAGVQGTAIIAAGQSDRAARQLVDYQEELNAAGQDFGTETQSCAISGGVECLHRVNREFAAAIARFREQLSDIEMPATALGFAEAVDDDAAELIDILEVLATTSDQAQYESHARRFGEAAQRFDEHFEDLLDVLRGL